MTRATILVAVLLLLFASAASAEPHTLRPVDDDHVFCSRSMANAKAYARCMVELPRLRQKAGPLYTLPDPPPQRRAPLEMVCFQIGRFLDCSSEY
jgi:hypothetical protein